MDNITHTLIGVTVAQVTISLQKRYCGEVTHSRSIFWAAIIAANFPDSDVFLKKLLDSSDMSNLLHHRGYTHTFLACIPSAWIAAVIGNYLGRDGWLRHRWERASLSVFGASVLGALSHLLADYWNNYGIHPWSPFLNQWYYGDFIFIVEPALWLAALPLAFFSTKLKIARGIWLLVLASLLGLMWFGPFMTWPIALAMSVWGIVNFIIQYYKKSALLTLASMGVVLAVFYFTSFKAKDLVKNQLHQANAEIQIQQLAAAPNPGNPFCWDIVVSTRESGNIYRVKTGSVSLHPAWFSARECVLRPGLERTAPMNSVTIESTSNIHWEGEFSGSLVELQKLAKENCRVEAFIRFSRHPFWITGNVFQIVGDIRYDRETGLGFAEFDIAQEKGCPDFIPPWVPPIGEDFLKPE